MTGTINCVYETPCGWCSKWDKKCDKQILERGQRAKINTIDDAMDAYIEASLTNILCESDSDHEWDCCGISTIGSTYRCKKCGIFKTFPIDYKVSTTTLNAKTLSTLT